MEDLYKISFQLHFDLFTSCFSYTFLCLIRYIHEKIDVHLLSFPINLLFFDISYKNIKDVFFVNNKYLMQVKEQIHPNGSMLDLHKMRPNNHKIITTQSTITIRASKIILVIHGNRNTIKIEDSAGRVTIQGNENHVQIIKSWMSCELEGNSNIFTLIHAQFQLKRHQGVGNYIPGVLGENPLQMANRRLLLQERYINLRLNSQRQNTKNIKKYWPSLVKSRYQSENRECPICYDDIKNEDEVTSLFCFHLFHSTCIEACLQTTTKCPVCSLDILQFIKEQIKAGNYVCNKDELSMKESMEE